MKEDQHTEFKRLWKDEFLRELCAFADSKGFLFAGVRGKLGTRLLEDP